MERSIAGAPRSIGTPRSATVRRDRRRPPRGAPTAALLSERLRPCGADPSRHSALAAMPQVAPTDAEAATGTKSAQPSAIEDDTDEAVSQAILKQSEMSEQMQAAAIEVAAKAVAKGGWDNEIAARIKKEMDKKFQSSQQGRVALHRRPRLWLVRDARGEALHLLLPAAGPQPAGEGWRRERPGPAENGGARRRAPPRAPRARLRARRRCFPHAARAPRAPPMFRSRRTRRALPQVGVLLFRT